MIKNRKNTTPLPPPPKKLARTKIYCCAQLLQLCVWLFADLRNAAYDSPLSMRFSRQEIQSEVTFPSPGNLPTQKLKLHIKLKTQSSLKGCLCWNLLFKLSSSTLWLAQVPKQTYIYMICVCVCSITQSCLTLCDPMDCSPPDVCQCFSRQNTGVVYHFLLQEIFLTQGSQPLLFVSPALAGRFFTTEPPGKISHIYHTSCFLFLSTFRNTWTFIKSSMLQSIAISIFGIFWPLGNSGILTHSHPRPVIEWLIHDEIKYL